MTIYEHRDDYGFHPDNTWDSNMYGSAGPAIACCNIRVLQIAWVVDEKLQNLNQSIDKRGTNSDGSRGRGLDELEEDVDVFTPEEFREMFGYDPEEDEEAFFLNE